MRESKAGRVKKTHLAIPFPLKNFLLLLWPQIFGTFARLTRGCFFFFLVGFFALLLAFLYLHFESKEKAKENGKRKVGYTKKKKERGEKQVKWRVWFFFFFCFAFLFSAFVCEVPFFHVCLLALLLLHLLFAPDLLVFIVY